MIFLQLFLTFFEIGLFTFGGGYAMISLIRDKTLELGWLTEEELLNMIAVSESTPGPIAINSATFVGYRAAGVIGSACATFGVVLPSFVIILAISYVLDQFQQVRAVRYAFNGIRAGVLALLVNALWVLFRAESFSQALTIYSGMVNFSSIGLDSLNTIVYDGIISFPSIANYGCVFGIIAVLLGVVFFGTSSADLLTKFRQDKRTALVSALLFCVSILCLGRNSVFIYFNF